jgi:predicted PurR-regulated permease PerM
MSFWDIVWYIIIVFAFVAYLMILFSILSDLFRDHKTNGWVKAIWVIFLIVAPFITALVYLIARGSGMAERSAKQMKDMQAAQDSYIKQVAGDSSPADQIHRAKELLDSGAIDADEFAKLKAKALA